LYSEGDSDGVTHGHLKPTCRLPYGSTSGTASLRPAPEESITLRDPVEGVAWIARAGVVATGRRATLKLDQKRKGGWSCRKATCRGRGVPLYLKVSPRGRQARASAYPPPAPKPGMVAPEAVASRVLAFLEGLPEVVAKISTRALKEQAGLTDVALRTFTRALETVEEAAGWRLQGRSLVRA
jgi:hypothetical protein